MHHPSRIRRIDMLERFINALLQFIHIIQAHYQALLQRYGYADEPSRPSICMTDRISHEEIELEFKAAVVRLNQFGLTAEKNDGLITIMKHDASKQPVCPQRFTRIIPQPIVETHQHFPSLPIECIIDAKSTAQLRSVKMDEHFAIEELLPEVGYVEMWTVRRDSAPPQRREGLTVFFEHYSSTP